MKKITVKQPADKPEVPTEVIADAIIAISEGVKKLRQGRLTDSALYLLIQRAAPNVGKYNSTPVSITYIKSVMQGMESLEATFLKKKPAK